MPKEIFVVQEYFYLTELCVCMTEILNINESTDRNMPKRTLEVEERCHLI